MGPKDTLRSKDCIFQKKIVQMKNPKGSGKSRKMANL
jgi:hypothetical protein